VATSKIVLRVSIILSEGKMQGNDSEYKVGIQHGEARW
jgi:hypothetical protein